MNALIWNTVLENTLNGLLGGVFRWPIIGPILHELLDIYVLAPIFLMFARLGVNLSIDWETEEEYNAYHKEAVRLVAAQEQEEWNPDERKTFRDAARKLIRLHPRGE